MSTILVTGGTGTIGRRVVPLLQAAGSKIRVLSRRADDRGDGIEYLAVDLLTGEGLDQALDGVDVVLHLAGGPKGDEIGTRNLVAAAERAKVGHLVHISVTAVDQLPLTYFRSKLGAEQAVRGSSVPWTVLRVAQLHDRGVPEARLYGHDPTDGVGGDGAFFLLLDEPEVYGLPPDPVVTTRDLPKMWKRAGLAAVAMAAAAVAAFVGGSS